MNDPDMILGRANIGRVFKGDPRMTCFKEHAQHFSPKLDGFHFFKQWDVSRLCHLFVFAVSFFKGSSIKIVKIGYIVGTKESP
ncbi:MAG: hypothetical protein ACD_17C00122G0002 [uncultured bacterium]|nr:MAG: hypothetical protein ACD_17C00122G0002 [uncultured bacterium]